MKNISKMFKRMFQASVFLSVLSLIFGLVLLLNTEDILTTISLVLGGGLLFIGILLCVRYFGKETIISSLEANLQLGILSILLGLTLIIFKNILYILVPILVGIIIIINSINKLDIAFIMKRDGVDKWYITFISAIITLIAGICLIVNPLGGTFLVTKAVGIIIIISSILDLIDTLNLIIQIKKTGKELKKIFKQE